MRYVLERDGATTSQIKTINVVHSLQDHRPRMIKLVYIVLVSLLLALVSVVAAINQESADPPLPHAAFGIRSGTVICRSLPTTRKRAIPTNTPIFSHHAAVLHL